MYWTPAQMLTHHASGGSNLRPGDLLASGPVSGAASEARGCLLELTWRGRDPISLPTGAPIFGTFEHLYQFEWERNTAGVMLYYDGGVVEYSVDGGPWLDAGAKQLASSSLPCSRGLRLLDRLTCPERRDARTTLALAKGAR